MQVTTRRKVVDQGDAEDLLGNWAASRLTLRDFCARERIDGRSLQCWRTNLERRSSSGAGVQLVELTLSPRPTSRAVYRVVVGEVAVEVDDGFREDTLSRLLAVVARC